jgi:hypothetical protein
MPRQEALAKSDAAIELAIHEIAKEQGKPLEHLLADNAINARKQLISVNKKLVEQSLPLTTARRTRYVIREMRAKLFLAQTQSIAER